MSTLSNARRPLATALRLIRDGDAAAFRGYIHSLYETDGFGLTEAGELLHAHTMKHNADFVKSLCESAPANEEGLSLVCFLSEHFFPRFSMNPEQRRLLQRVYLLHKNLAVSVYDKLRTRRSGEIAYAACCTYADFQDPHNSVGRISLITARTRALEIMEDMVLQYDDHTLQLQLAEAYRGMAEYYAQAADKKSRDSALQYSRKALDLCRKLHASVPDLCTSAMLATAKENCADLLQHTVMFKQAETLYERALELRKAAAEADSESLLPLAWSCCKLADFHTQRKGAGKREKAIALYEQAAEIFKNAELTLPNLQLDYAHCRKALGDLYAHSDKVKELIIAFDHYKAASALLLRSEHLATPMDYANCRYSMALTLWRAGGDNNLNTALNIMGELTELTAMYPDLGEYESRIFFLTYALEERLWIRHPLERQHPEFHTAYQHALGCGEILEILSYLPQKYHEMLSCREWNRLRTDALPFYKKHIDSSLPLKQQELTKTASDWVTEFMKQVK